MAFPSLIAEGVSQPRAQSDLNALIPLPLPRLQQVSLSFHSFWGYLGGWVWSWEDEHVTLIPQLSRRKAKLVYHLHFRILQS